MEISIITSALPPRLDGIGDYTANLAAELAKTNKVTILTGQGFSPTPISGVTIRQVFDIAQPHSVQALLPVIEVDTPDWVLLQYNPFCYGRWGLNLTLPNVMRCINRLSSHPKFALMMHEPFVPTNSPRFAVMATWQRWQLWQLGRAADLMFCSIDPWAKRFQRWFPKTPVRHLPVGSNIPLVPITREEARTRLGIADETFVLGLFGTAHGTRMLDWVSAAAASVKKNSKDVLVLYMGPNGAAVCREMGDLPTLAEGPLLAEEISRRFAAVDVALAPFMDGVSTRRTSLMTALQHGIATVGTEGLLTDAVLSCEKEKAMLLADVDRPDEFNAHVLRLARDVSLRQKIGQEAKQLYDREFNWPMIAERTLVLLNEPNLSRKKENA